MATNQDKIATIGDIRNLLSTAREKGVTIKNDSGAEWTIPSSFNDDSLCVTYRQLNGTVLPQYSDNATDKISSTDGVVISNFKGGTVAYSDNQLVRLGDITLKSVYLADNSFEVGVTSSANTSCAVSATCQYTYGVNEASYTYEATEATIKTVTSSGTSGTWSGTDSSTSNTLSNQGANSSFTDTRSFTISCSTTIGGQNVSDSTTIVQPTRERDHFISSSSTADSHTLELTVDQTSFGCDGGAANVTIYHVYGSSTSTTYEDTCGVQYTVVSGDGQQRETVGTSAYTIPAISCDTITGSTTKSHTLTAAYTYQDSEGASHEITGSTSVSQECESCQMAYKYTMVDGTVQSGTCFSDKLWASTIQGPYYDKAQKIEIFDCITGFFDMDYPYYGGEEITSITMSDNVVALPQNFALGAGKLKYVKLSAKLKTIPMNAFHSCSGLTEINFIPNGVETIEQQAFMNCESASSATIPSSVTAIGKRAFKFCYDLKDIYMKPNTPPTIMSNTFVDLPSDYIIHVPCDSETAYKTASAAWKAISGHVKGDCSCTSCFDVQTNELPSSGSGSEGFTCALVTVTGTNAICSQFNKYSAMPTDITPAGDYSSWITSAWTPSINNGFELNVVCTENNTSAERYATFHLSGEKCTDGIEINLTQPINHSCFENYHKIYEGCTVLPSGSQLLSTSIVGDSDYCQGLTFNSNAYTEAYSSPTINIEGLELSDDKKTISVIGSMSKNTSGLKTGTTLIVTASTSNDTITRNLIIEQTACVDGECNCNDSNYMSWIRSCPSSGSSNIALVTLSGTCNNITYDNATCDEDFVNITGVTTVNGNTDHPSFLVKGTVSRNTSTSSRAYTVTLTSSTQPCTYATTVTQNANTATICSDNKVIIKTCKNNNYIDVISDTAIKIGKQGQTGWSFVSLKAPKGKPKLTSDTNIAYRIDFGDAAPWLQYIQRNNNGPFSFADNADICYFGCSTENTTGRDRTATMTITYTDSNGGVCETDITITQSGTEGTLPFQITGVTLQHVCKEERKAYYTIDYQGTAPSTATCTVQTVQYGGEQYGVGDTAVAVNHEVQSIAIHSAASSASTISLTVIPNSGVNTSSPSFRTTIESNDWIECSGTITLTSKAASNIITTGSTSEMEYTLGLSYSGSKTIDTSNASIKLYAYSNITTTNRNCLQCALSYNNETLCEHDISLTKNEIASLVTRGSLRVTKTIKIGNDLPSVCNYKAGAFYGIYGSSNTTSIRIGDGFLENRLG